MNVLCESLLLCCSGRLALDFCVLVLYCDVQELHKGLLEGLAGIGYGDRSRMVAGNHYPFVMGYSLRILFDIICFNISSTYC